MKRWLFWIWLGVVSVALAAFAYLGTFSRIIADDYCTALGGLQANPLENAINAYYTWTGLYTNFFIKSALAPLQPAIHPWMLLLFIVLWFITLVWLARLMLVKANWHAPNHTSVILAILIILTTLSSSASPQNLYWFGAMIPYTYPLIMLTVTGGGLWLLLSEKRAGWVNLVGALGLGVLVLATSGMSEIYATLQVPLLFFALLAALWLLPRERRLFAILLVGFLLVLAAGGLIVVAIAPGNFVRRSSLGVDSWRITSFVWLVLKESLKLLTVTPAGLLPALFSFAVPFGLYYGAPSDVQKRVAALPLRRAWLWVLVVGIGGFTLIMAGITPSMYATANVELRTMLPMRVIQCAVFACWGAISLLVWLRMPALSNSRGLQTGVITICGVLLLVLPLFVLDTARTMLPQFQTYATGWDARHADIVAAVNANAPTVEVASLAYDLETYLILNALDAEWVNECANGYYGVDIDVAPPTS